MRHRLTPFLAATLLASTLLIAGLTAPAAAQDRLISVTGTGQVSIEPDMATVTIGVQSEDEDAAVALDVASAATAAILATLDGQGIEAEFIRTGTIRLSPKYASSVLTSATQISGYTAVNSVEVEVNDLGALGGILAAVVGDGANRLDGVNFGLKDPSAALDEARRRAVAEGARLAALYADAAGVSVGDLVTLQEGGSGGYRPIVTEARQMELAASSPQYDVPISAGKIELSASVSMVYAIETE